MCSLHLDQVVHHYSCKYVVATEKKIVVILFTDTVYRENGIPSLSENILS